MVAMDRDSKCRKEGFERLRDGERAGDEEMVRDIKRSYREVTDETVSGEYKVELVTSFVGSAGNEGR